MEVRNILKVVAGSVLCAWATGVSGQQMVPEQRISMDVSTVVQHAGVLRAEAVDGVRAKKEFEVTSIFTDITCSELKKGVTRRKVARIADPVYRNIADALLRGVYPTASRCREYKAYLHPEQVAKVLKTNPFNYVDNATGISVKKGDELVVMLGNTNGETVGLRLMMWKKGYNAKDFKLSEGINKIAVPDSGLLYVTYFSDKYKELKPVRVHIATGEVNGVFDIVRHNNVDWKNMLDSAKYDYFDVLGKYAHLIYRTEDFKTFCPEDVVRLVQVYDSIVSLEQELIGLHKYDRVVPNRILYQSVNHSYMYATSYRTAYNANTMKAIIPVAKARAHWGLYHEVGHMHQTRPGVKWIGMTEVTNNLYSMHVQRVFGYPSRLMEGGYKSAYDKIIVPKNVHALNGPFEKLVPFWQLYLYMGEVKNQPDFYMDLHEQVRREKNPASNGQAQLNFVKMCCDIAKTDFTDFFESWGFLRPIDDTIRDYATQPLKCTAEEIAAVKAYVQSKGYAKPLALEYLRDNNVALFKTPRPVVAGEAKLEKDKIVLKGWQNAVAYELYRAGEADALVLSKIEVADTFAVKDWKAGDVLKVVAADGTRTVVTLN